MESEDDHAEQAYPPTPTPAPKSRQARPWGGDIQSRLPVLTGSTNRITKTTSTTTTKRNSDPFITNPNPSSSHIRDESGSSGISYKGVETTAQAALSIRPVTDTTLKVVNAAKSPYPTKPNQFLYPSGTFNFIEGFPAISSARAGQKIIDVGRNSEGESNSGNSSNNSNSRSSSSSNTDRKKNTSDGGIGILGAGRNKSNIGKVRGLRRPTTKRIQEEEPDHHQNQQASKSTIAIVHSNTKNDNHHLPPTTILGNNNFTTSDTPKVRKTLFNNAARPTPISGSPSFLPLHNEPRLVPLSAQASRSFSISPNETPPGEVVIEEDQEYHYSQTKPDDSPLINEFYDYNYLDTSSSSSNRTGRDVDRLAMVEGDFNVNNDHLGVPPFLTPREQQKQHQQLRQVQFQQPGGLSSNPVTPWLQPGTSSSPRLSGGGLGAIASVASDLDFDSTPISVGESVDSSGTVVRKKGYTGPIPPGYYSLFPPTSTPQSSGSRTTPDSNGHRRRRSTSAPPRPISDGPLSPIAPGRQSPVSPVSPDDNDSLYSSSRPHTRSRSDSLWNIGNLQTPMVLIPGFDSNRSSQYSIGNQIPRKPVARSNAVKFNSFMSTIHSESESDAYSNMGLSPKDRDSHTTGDPKSATSSTFKAKELYRRSSSALPRPYEPEEAPLPSTSATIDFSQTDTPFPMGDLSEDAPLTPRRPVPQRPRIDSEKSIAGYASLPSRKQSNNVTSPTSVYSRAEYRDSYSQTEVGVQTDRNDNLPRDVVPAWARLYYSNERRHRETLGQVSGSRSSSRRHTVGTTHGNIDQLHSARQREATAARRRNSHIRHASNPEDRSVFHGEDIMDEPRLRHNRAGAIRRRTMFMAPSIDEATEGAGMTRRNIQVWCFVIGFVFPLAWWAAALLPLPPCPSTPPGSPGFEYDLEKTLGPVDQARYENARWWRNINRIMSVVGVGVIVAIIVLAVVASKMVNGQYT